MLNTNKLTENTNSNFLRFSKNLLLKTNKLHVFPKKIVRIYYTFTAYFLKDLKYQ